MKGIDQIQRNLSKLESRLHQQAGLAADEIAQYLESYSKQNAPFTDRSTNLRGSIDGDWERVRIDLYRVILSAGMDYAIFVELVRDGKYAFLWPAIVDSQEAIRGIWRERLADAF